MRKALIIVGWCMAILATLTTAFAMLAWSRRHLDWFVPVNEARLQVDGLPNRSEEHTSELQSPYELVCRLVLEKKNKAVALWLYCALTCRLVRSMGDAVIGAAPSAAATRVRRSLRRRALEVGMCRLPRLAGAVV